MRLLQLWRLPGIVSNAIETCRRVDTLPKARVQKSCHCSGWVQGGLSLWFFSRRYEFLHTLAWPRPNRLSSKPNDFPQAPWFQNQHTEFKGPRGLSIVYNEIFSKSACYSKQFNKCLHTITLLERHLLRTFAGFWREKLDPIPNLQK